MKFTERIKQTVPIPPVKQAVLNVLVTNSWLLGCLSEVMKPYGVTPQKYNVLRILRGSHPAYLKVADIRDRLLDRAPDTTRLLGRLDKDGLIGRRQSRRDHRVVEVRITPKGLRLLEAMKPDMDALFATLRRQLDDTEFTSLSTLLDDLREGLE